MIQFLNIDVVLHITFYLLSSYFTIKKSTIFENFLHVHFEFSK